MYLLLIICAALCSAVVNTINSHFDVSIFKTWKGTFFQPHEVLGWNAVSVAAFGKIFFLLLAATVARTGFFGIPYHTSTWFWQLIYAMIAYAVTLVLLLEFVFTKNVKIDEHTI
jgi:hypothetical protein